MTVFICLSLFVCHQSPPLCGCRLSINRLLATDIARTVDADLQALLCSLPQEAALGVAARVTMGADSRTKGQRSRSLGTKM